MKKIILTIEVEIEGEPCGCGDSTHQAQYFAEALEAVGEATTRFYQCNEVSTKLTATDYHP